MKYFFTFICVIAFVSVQQIAAVDKCIQKSPCSCKYNNGTGYDLSVLAKSLNDNYLPTPSIGALTFFFHPCSDISNPIDSGNYSVSEIPPSQYQIAAETNVNSIILISRLPLANQ